MVLSMLHVVLWLYISQSAFTLTTQELVRLNVSSVVTAECGQPVTLHCNISSSREGLSIKELIWYRGTKPLCSVDDMGNTTTHSEHDALSDFRCNYTQQEQLSLTFTQVQPMESGKYLCKLHSNFGTPKNYTRVDLQECAGLVHADVTPVGPTCTFNRVHPDGEVHWFRGSRQLHGHSLRPTTSKQVNAGGWLTIRSSLEGTKDTSLFPYREPYNCSLWNNMTGRYIASSLVPNQNLAKTFALNGVKVQAPPWILLTGLLLLTTLLMK